MVAAANRSEKGRAAAISEGKVAKLGDDPPDIGHRDACEPVPVPVAALLRLEEGPVHPGPLLRAEGTQAGQGRPCGGPRRRGR